MRLLWEQASEGADTQRAGQRVWGGLTFLEFIAALLTRSTERLAVRVTETDAMMGANNRPFIVYDTMTPEQTQAFLRGCKALGLSVTGCVTAVYLDALAEVIARTKPVAAPFQLTASIVASPRAVVLPRFGMHEMTPCAGSTASKRAPRHGHTLSEYDR